MQMLANDSFPLFCLGQYKMVNMSQNPAHRVLFLGHSFIWRLEDFITKSTFPCVAKDFALPPSTSIRFRGIGGRTVATLRRHDLAVVASFKPNILVLEIGSNDLCDPTLSVAAIATNIIQLINMFHFRYKVTHIMLGEIIPRLTLPPTCPDYNKRAHHLNRILLALLKRASYATFWFHPKMTTHSTLFFGNDGVHFNMAGNHFLHHSYQEALHYCCRRLARMATNRRRLLSSRATWSSRQRATRQRPY